MITVFILGVLLVCCIIVWYMASTLPDDLEKRNDVIQVKKEMYLAMSKQGKKFEATPVKNLYKPTFKKWIRD
ncbi:hypothetical protein UFOVP328_389 [uncultured Caudovirales phage]|uniref:Uncharacterized protein n=1 Tax=uncultured Caudovirales phage TaxID=2100421 RepID=A0A6J5LZ94_9CAUD|nr:hypothetical protein UFOVP328_389 [uncultured Caudovirales phage]